MNLFKPGYIKPIDGDYPYPVFPDSHGLISTTLTCIWIDSYMVGVIASSWLLSSSSPSAGALPPELHLLCLPTKFVE